MLKEFLAENESEILKLTEGKTLELSGVRPTSVQLKQGLPIFFKQLLSVLAAEAAGTDEKNEIDKPALIKAANESDEPALAKASLHPQDAKMAVEAGIQGKELFRLGYTFSHVVHAYGSMCQAITQIATEKKATITPAEFNNLNRCLDVAIAGAVTEYQSVHNTHEKGLQIKHLGFLAHELRNSLSIVTTSLQLIQRGTVGFGGSTAEVLNNGLKNMAELIDRSLAEVRLSVDPAVHRESVNLLRLVDQISVTAGIDARARKQTLEINIHPELVVEVDKQLIYSSIYNLIQNALKYTHVGGTIKISAETLNKDIVLQIEDECGGLSHPTVDLFKAFEQQNENRQGLGLGLTIAQRAVELNHGTISVTNLPGHGCVFKITLPSV